jgi:hypothetical protein
LSPGWISTEGAIISLATLPQTSKPTMPPERVDDFEAVRFGTDGGDIAQIVQRFSQLREA